MVGKKRGEGVLADTALDFFAISFLDTMDFFRKPTLDTLDFFIVSFLDKYILYKLVVYRNIYLFYINNSCIERYIFLIN